MTAVFFRIYYSMLFYAMSELTSNLKTVTIVKFESNIFFSARMEGGQEELKYPQSKS